MDQLPNALSFLKELGLEDPEFHFTDIWAGKGEYQKLNGSHRCRGWSTCLVQNLSLFIPAKSRESGGPRLMAAGAHPVQGGAVSLNGSRENSGRRSALSCIMAKILAFPSTTATRVTREHPTDDGTDRYILRLLEPRALAEFEEHMLFCGSCLKRLTHTHALIVRIRAALRGQHSGTGSRTPTDTFLSKDHALTYSILRLRLPSLTIDH
jgi:hypothetical protein